MDDWSEQRTKEVVASGLSLPRFELPELRLRRPGKQRLKYCQDLYVHFSNGDGQGRKAALERF